MAGSEYAPGCNYGRVMNMPGFRVWQVSALEALYKVLNMAE